MSSDINTVQSYNESNSSPSKHRRIATEPSADTSSGVQDMDEINIHPTPTALETHSRTSHRVSKCSGCGNDAGTSEATVQCARYNCWKSVSISALQAIYDLNFGSVSFGMLPKYKSSRDYVVLQ